MGPAKLEEDMDIASYCKGVSKGHEVECLSNIKKSSQVFCFKSQYDSKET